MSNISEIPLDGSPDNLDASSDDLNQDNAKKKSIGFRLDEIGTKKINDELYQITYKGEDGEKQQIFIYNVKGGVSYLPKPSKGDFIGNIAKDYDWGKLSESVLRETVLRGLSLWKEVKESSQSNNDGPGNTKSLVKDNIRSDGNDLNTIEFEEIYAQIENLRGRISRLIPVQQALDELVEIRSSSLLVRYFQATGFSFPLLSIISRKFLGNLHDLHEASRFREKLRRRSSHSQSPEVSSVNKSHQAKGKKEGEAEYPYTEIDNPYLRDLNIIQTTIETGEANNKVPVDSKIKFRILCDRVNVQISQVNSEFKGFIYPSILCEKLLENMANKIGHLDLKEESEMHLGVVKQMILRLDQEQLSDSNFDVLGDQAVVAINIFKEIEQRKSIVERLVSTDQDRRSWTVIVVVFYIVFIVFAMAMIFANYGPQLELGTQPLSELRLPVFGIPWPVALWSFIGSIAAMIYRFNKNPIYNFGNAIKWLLTRPVQGVVLGSTFYLVLVSGLFLLTGRDTTDSSGVIKVDEVILVLSFLVGFSDRFADAVFNTLVDRFSKDAERDPENDSPPTSEGSFSGTGKS